MRKIYRIAELPCSSAAFSSLPIVRAYVDAISPLPDGTVNVSGWLFLPDRPLDRIDVYRDGIRVMSLPLAQRPDVADVFRWIPHASTCGFNFILPPRENQSAGTSILEIVALDRGTPAGRFSHFVRADKTAFPTHPKITCCASPATEINITSRSAGLRSLENLWRLFADMQSFSNEADPGLGLWLRSRHCSPNGHRRSPRSPRLRY